MLVGDGFPQSGKADDFKGLAKVPFTPESRYPIKTMSCVKIFFGPFLRDWLETDLGIDCVPQPGDRSKGT